MKLSAPLSPEDRKATQCSGKERIESAERARKIARRQTKKYGRTYNAYRCRECGKWHTGSGGRFETLTPEEERGWLAHWRLLRKRNRTKAKG